MLPNCSGVVSWPRHHDGRRRPDWPGTLGRSPMVPAETCAFCARIALLTSLVDRL
jgi:hypothetical protein